jgi:hypothetical protein
MIHGDELALISHPRCLRNSLLQLSSILLIKDEVEPGNHFHLLIMLPMYFESVVIEIVFEDFALAHFGVAPVLEDPLGRSMAFQIFWISVMVDYALGVLSFVERVKELEG